MTERQVRCQHPEYTACDAPARKVADARGGAWYRCNRDHPFFVRDPVVPGPTDPTARRSDPSTSHDAAASVREQAKAQRAPVLGVLAAEGRATADRIDEVLTGEGGWLRTTASRRLPELKRLGQVRRLAETAPTRSGRQAKLWELNPEAT